MYVCIYICMCVHMYICMHVCMHVCVYGNDQITHNMRFTYVYGTPVGIPYLSVLKPGANTHRGSTTHQVVQQNERNKCLGPFKRQVPKLLNLINIRVVPNIKEN